MPLATREIALKLEAIKAHTSQFKVDREYLESFVKAEEIFWRA